MIIITEVTKNLSTGEKTKSKKKTDCMVDWVNAINTWGEAHCVDDQIVTAIYHKKKMKLGLETRADGFLYRISVEWKN